MIARLDNARRLAMLSLGQVGLALLWQGTAYCQTPLQPYAAADYEYDSNLFALPADAALLGIPPGTRRADSVFEALAGVRGDFRWPVDELTLTAEGRRFHYENHGSLDHDEYLLGGKFTWAAADILDGAVIVRQEHLLEPFAQQVSTVIALETDRSAEASVRIGLHPRWHLAFDVKPHETRAPQPNLPNFSLRETTSTLALTWQVVSKLTLGVDGRYVQGGYHGGPIPLPYRQNGEDLTVAYVATGLSSFEAAVGRAAFETPTAPAGNTSATTGTLGYTRRLTGKTSVTIQFVRGLNTYIAAGNSELDTSGLLTVDWRATRKITVDLTGQETHSVFSGTPLVAVYPAGLKDHFFTAVFNVDYQAVQWLDVRLYGQYQDRNANSPFFTFNSRMIGIELRSQVGPPIPK